MKPNLRRVFFFVYAIFFIIVTPILIVVSLGYDFNFNNFELLNTLKVNISTLPRTAPVYYNGKQIFDTPGEIKILNDEVVNLSIQNKGYIPEDFLLWSEQSRNSVVSIENLAFLPVQGEVLTYFGDFTPVTILSDGYVLLEKDKEYFIQEFNFNGIVGEKQKINNSSKSILTEGKWDRLDSGFYFKKDQQVILYFDVELDGWEIYSFQKLDIQVESLELFDKNNLLLLDSNKTLWNFNIVNNTISFISSRVEGLNNTDSPDRIWFNKDGGLYFLDKKNDIESLQFDNDNLYVDSLFEYVPGDVKSSYFEVSNVGQGIAVLADNRIVYIPDFNKEKFVFIADNVANLESFNRNVYWVDNNSVLWNYNFLNQDIDRLGQIETEGSLEDIEFEYFPFWKRLFVYSQKSVHSVWIDQDLSNENILEYSKVKWLKDSKCQDEIIERYQICINQEGLVRYSNLSNF